MPYLLFFIYIIAGCFLLYRSALLRNSGLPVLYWIVFFCVKVAAGCYYGYWYATPKNIVTSDTWRFHYHALEEYKLLIRQPSAYFLNIFTDANNNWSDILASKGYWNNLKDNLMLKIISLMNIISGGHYYVNVVIYSFITFFGFVFLYLACKNALHKTPHPLTTVALLLTPSCLFWTSGLHRDGFMLLFIGMVFWYGSKLIYGKSLKKGHIAGLILSLTGLFLIRNYVAILLLPPLITWVLTHKYSIRPGITYPVVIVVLTGVIFISSLMNAGFNIPSKLIERKQAFDNLQGTSRLPDINLSPSLKSFIRYLPDAVDHALFRPYIWNAKTVMEKIAALEFLLIVCISTWVQLRYDHQNNGYTKNFQWMIVMFCISLILVIGYTIPFAGAIVRYRAVFLMLLFVLSTLTIKSNIKFD